MFCGIVRSTVPQEITLCVSCKSFWGIDLNIESLDSFKKASFVLGSELWEDDFSSMLHHRQKSTRSMEQTHCLPHRYSLSKARNSTVAVQHIDYHVLLPVPDETSAANTSREVTFDPSAETVGVREGLIIRAFTACARDAIGWRKSDAKKTPWTEVSTSTPALRCYSSTLVSTPPHFSRVRETRLTNATPGNPLVECLPRCLHCGFCIMSNAHASHNVQPNVHSSPFTFAVLRPQRLRGGKDLTTQKHDGTCPNAHTALA